MVLIFCGWMKLWSNINMQYLDELPERKAKRDICGLVLKVYSNFSFNNFSNFIRLNRTVSYCLRFGSILKL